MVYWWYSLFVIIMLLKNNNLLVLFFQSEFVFLFVCFKLKYLLCRIINIYYVQKKILI